MKKEIRNKGHKIINKNETSKNNKIFSPRNLLIGFVGIISLLLIFNYFYPVFYGGNDSFDQNYEEGNLYQSAGGGSSGSDDEDDKCEGVTCPVCQKCNQEDGRCIANDLSGCNGGGGVWYGMCKDGRCPDCSSLNCKGQCQVCKFDGNGNPSCNSEEREGLTCTGRGGVVGECFDGECPNCGAQRCNSQCQTCVKEDRGSGDYATRCRNNDFRICLAPIGSDGRCFGGSCYPTSF